MTGSIPVLNSPQKMHYSHRQEYTCCYTLFITNFRQDVVPFLQTELPDLTLLILLLQYQDHQQKIQDKLPALPPSQGLFTVIVLPILLQIWQMCSYFSHSLRGCITLQFILFGLYYHFPYLQKSLIPPTFIDVQKISLASTMYIKVYFTKSMQHN